MSILTRLLTCLVFCVHCGASLAQDQQKIEDILDKILSGQVNYSEHKEHLSKIIETVETQIQEDVDNAYLWYLKGRSSWAALYVFDRSDRKHQLHRALIPAEYKKALQLNRVSNVLNETQLISMIGSDWIWTEAARQYIALRQTKTTLEEIEHITLLWERVILGLVRQNKFKEAYHEMSLMEASFSSEKLAYDNGKPYRVKLDELIKERKEKLSNEE